VLQLRKGSYESNSLFLLTFSVTREQV
jgi:hypothetical protein